MRKIKFRQAIFQNSEFNHWHYWGFVGYRDEFVGPITITGLRNTYKVQPSERYTGIKDEEGLEIDWWDGDLLRKGSDHSCAPIGIITYNEQDARWTLIGKSGGEFCGLAQAYMCGWAKIGNIHQPERLENK